MSGVPRKRPASAPQLVASIEPLKVGGTGVPDNGGPGAPQDGTPVVPESRPAGVPDNGGTGVPESRTTEVPDNGAPGVPRYKKLRRMDARLRPDQVKTLAELRERLSQDRQERTERITESTLIRLGLDLLFERAQFLRGDTEDELRTSVAGMISVRA